LIRSRITVRINNGFRTVSSRFRTVINSRITVRIRQQSVPDRVPSAVGSGPGLISSRITVRINNGFRTVNNRFRTASAAGSGPGLISRFWIASAAGSGPGLSSRFRTGLMSSWFRIGVARGQGQPIGTFRTSAAGSPD
jgi:hypothetical protein